MEALPASLLYYTQQIAQFTSNQIKINPLNSNAIGSKINNQMRFSLPVNSIANMKSLTLHTVMELENVAETAANAGNAVLGNWPVGGAGACLDRVTFSLGGVSLDNGSTPYHVVQAVRNNLKKGLQKNQSDDRVLAQAHAGATRQGNAFEAKSYKEFAVTNFCGFPECEPTYLDLNLIPECQITLQSASNAVIPVQQQDLGPFVPPTNTGKVEYALTDCHMSLEVITIGSGMYDAITQRVMAERGSLDVPYKQFQVFSSDTTDGQAFNCTGSVSCMSLDRIMVVLQRNSARTGASNTDTDYAKYTDQQPYVQCADQVGTACVQACHNFSSGGIREWQMTVNNAPFPLYRLKAGAESFAVAVNADDRSYSNDRGGLVTSAEAWAKNKWCAVQRFCFDEDPRRLSGTNLSAINAQFKFSPTAVKGGSDTPSGADARGAIYPQAGEAQRVLMITEQTSVLRIGGGRAVSVIA